MPRQNPITSTNWYDTDQVSLLVQKAAKDNDVGAVDCITNPGQLKHALLDHKAENPNEKTTLIPLFYKGTSSADPAHFVAAVRDVEVDAHGNEQEVIHIQDSNGNIRNVPPGIEDALQKAYPGAQIKQWNLRQQNQNGECGPITVQNLRDMAEFKHDNPNQALDDSALSIQAPRTQTEIETQRKSDNEELDKLYRQEQAKSQEAQKAKTKSNWDMAMGYIFGKGGLLDFRRTSLFTLLGGDIALDMMDNADKEKKVAKANAKAGINALKNKEESVSETVSKEEVSKEELREEKQVTSNNAPKPPLDIDGLHALPSDPDFTAHAQKKQQNASQLKNIVKEGDMPPIPVKISEASLTDLNSGNDKSQSFADQVKSKENSKQNNIAVQ